MHLTVLKGIAKDSKVSLCFLHFKDNTNALTSLLDEAKIFSKVKKLFDLISGWLRDPKFELRHALLFSSIILAIALVFSVVVSVQVFWVALGVMATFAAVLCALFREELRFWEKPKLVFGRFELGPPYFRKTRIINNQTGEALGTGYFINIELLNEGKAVAKNCQAFITAMGHLENGKWKKERNWLLVPLIWALVETYEAPTQERDMFPGRPYYFDLACWSNVNQNHKEKLLLRTMFMPTAQPDKFEPGEYCFEVTIFSENAGQVVKYFHIVWKGEFAKDPQLMTTRVNVFANDNRPW